jgi:hypothetical protein
MPTTYSSLKAQNGDVTAPDNLEPWCEDRDFTGRFADWTAGVGARFPAGEHYPRGHGIVGSRDSMLSMHHALPGADNHRGTEKVAAGPEADDSGCEGE